MTRVEEDVPTFVPLAGYEVPAGPAAHIVQRVRERIVRLVRRNDDRVVEDERLKRASRATIDDFTASPDCSLLARELDKTLGNWADAAEGTAADRLRLVVVPPGDVRGVIKTWARRHGHTLLEPPGRDLLTACHTIGLPELDGEGVLVLPRLERWFLRHRHGLDLVRALLAALAESERRCVIGCNSWAWSFLRRAADADLLLPEPITFAPFDAERLHTWFSELANAEETRAVTFRESGSKTDVFARDEDGEFESEYLASLAARSLGIPWVAWQLWQRSLRTLRVEENGDGEEVVRGEETGGSAGDGGGAGDGEGDGADGDADGVANGGGDESGGADGSASGDDDGNAGADGGTDDDVLWLVPPEELVLPRGHERGANLVLHALLMHGRLDVEELARVLPFVGESNLVPALVRSGHVERVGGCYRCVPGAYPDVVESLSTAGITMPPI